MDGGIGNSLQQVSLPPLPLLWARTDLCRLPSPSVTISLQLWAACSAPGWLAGPPVTASVPVCRSCCCCLSAIILIIPDLVYASNLVLLLEQLLYSGCYGQFLLESFSSCRACHC